MKTVDLVKRAGRNLKRAKLRTLLTSVAISVGGFAIVLSFAAGAGAKDYVDRIIGANLDKQTLAVYKDERLTDLAGSASSFSGGLQEYNPDKVHANGLDVVSLTSEDIEKLRNRDDIERVEPFYQFMAQYMEFSVKKGKKYTADTLAYDSSIVEKTEAGDLPPLHQQIGNDEAVVSRSFAKELGVSASDLVGSTVTLHVVQPPKELDTGEIKKAFEKGGEKEVRRLTEGKSIDRTYKIRAVLGLSVDQLSQQQGVFLSDESAKELSEFMTEGTDQYKKYAMAMATVKDGYDPEAVKDSLKKDKLYAMTAQDMQKILFTFVNTLQAIVIGFGLLALIVSVFGIVNTQYISVLERTNQIGLMKALGASKRDIAKLFRYEAAWVGFFGGVIGVLAAWGLGAIANPWITEKLSLGAGNHLLIFEPIPMIGVVVLLIVIAIISGWMPSRKAAKLDPIEALRTE